MNKQLLRQCLDTLEDAFSKLSVGCYVHGYRATIEALRKELEKLEAGPVFWQWRRKDQDWGLDVYRNEVYATTDDSEVRKLYTSTPDTEALRAELERIGAQNAKLYDDFNKSQLELAAKDQALRVALEALKRCYDVTEWPCNGETEQDKAIKQIESLGVK